MPVVIPKPVFILQVVGINNPGKWSFTLYYEPTGASVWTQANVDLISQHIADNLGPAILDVISEQGAIALYHGRLKTATQDLETYVTSGGGIGLGTVAGEQLPPQTCAEIQRRTGKPGRNMRGRIFISSISEEGQNNGVLVTGDTRNNLGVLAAGLGADVAVGAFTLHSRHWNRKTNTLEVVTQFRPMGRLVSRRDRDKTAANLPY